MSRTLYLGSELLELGPDTPTLRHARRSALIALMRSHPDVWRMHKINDQFVERDGVIGRKAVMHCAVQALRARALAWLLKLNPSTTMLLEKAAFLHDSYKAEERRHMNEHGADWHSYDNAQALARVSWEQSGLFGPTVINIATSVAHESLPLMVCLVTSGASRYQSFELAMMAMHFLDDISLNDDWVVPAKDGQNIIDFRTARNADNPTYQRLNQQGRIELPRLAARFGVEAFFTDNETTYQAQCRIGHMVERTLAELIMERRGVSFRPPDLPVILDNVLRTELRTMAGL